MDVGQAEIATGVAVGQFLVVAAQEMEDGGVQVVDVNPVDRGGKAGVVGGAMDVTAAHAAAGEPDR